MEAAWPIPNPICVNYTDTKLFNSPNPKGNIDKDSMSLALVLEVRNKK
jgi:hypothetical protein